MGTRIVHTNDLDPSDQEYYEEGKLGTMKVTGHPFLPQGAAVVMHAPEDVEAKLVSPSLVTVEWLAPGSHKATKAVMTLEDFGKLSKRKGHLDSRVEALAEELPARRGRTRSSEVPASAVWTDSMVDGVKAKPRRRRSKSGIDYGTLEHAGTPHRGRITEDEKEIVRNNFGAVNERLRSQGHKEIDFNDPKQAKKWGAE